MIFSPEGFRRRFDDFLQGFRRRFDDFLEGFRRRFDDFLGGFRQRFSDFSDFSDISEIFKKMFERNSRRDNTNTIVFLIMYEKYCFKKKVSCFEK